MRTKSSYANQNHNEPDDAQLEAMAIFMEEAGEALQALGKMLRHGKEGRNRITPNRVDVYDNLSDFRNEVLDVLFAIMLLDFVKILDMNNIEANEQYMLQKTERVVLHNIGRDKLRKHVRELLL